MLGSIKRLVCVASCIVGATIVMQADTTETRSWSIPRFSDDTAALTKFASSMKVSSGTDVVVLDDEKSFVIDADGNSVITTYLVYEVKTQKGAEGWDEVSQKWAPWIESQPKIRARVITPDGKIYTLDPKAITDAPAKEDDADTYSDRRVVRGPLPAMTDGAIVEEEETWTRKLSLPGTGVFGRFFFGRSVPVENSRLLIDLPSSLALHYKTVLMPDLKPERKEENGRVRVTFDTGHLEPDDRDDDDYWPSDTPEYRALVFSTESSWKPLADEYSKVVDRTIGAADVKPIVAKLIAGKVSRDEKLTAILQYLGREIRYTGVELGESAIIPHSPAETLKNKYGDCKDKATLLVTMLRAADIPANVALLNVGPGEDVEREYPGANQFDHAIVYVPGSPNYWIDATDEYARLGQLPEDDEGRLALIVRPGTDSLTMIPVSSAQDNLLVEKREFYLAENGPAHIVEISEPHGSSESDYRSSYGDKEDKEKRKALAEYVHAQYLADKLDKLEVSDAADLTKQFQLVLETNAGKRGVTDLDSALIAIRLESIFARLPEEFQEKKKTENKDDEKDKSKHERSTDYQLPRNFVTEWRYEVVPPPGFQPKALPKNAKVSLGPATLIEEFSIEKEGNVSAVIRFDTVKSRLTVAEAKQMGEKIAEVKDAQPIFIHFEPKAVALLNEGKARESFQAYREMIALHPNEALHHLQMANALLAAGLGLSARNEAQLAVKLEPASVLAQKTLAEILEYDLVGRKFERGSDYKGAEAAFRAAAKLDPNDHTIRGNLAILFEYNPDGDRYFPDAKLKEAVAEYQSLTPDQLADIGLKNNPPFALLYAGQFAEARKYAEGLNPKPAGVIVTAETALNGTAAGIAEARKLGDGEADAKKTMLSVAQTLMKMRIYPAAADMFEAGAAGDSAANSVGTAALLRKVKFHDQIQYADGASGLARTYLELSTAPNPTIEKMLPIMSVSAKEVLKNTDADGLDSEKKEMSALRYTLTRNGYPIDVMLDIVMQTLETKVEGDDAKGYRVRLIVTGKTNNSLYIVKEDGKYKILDSSEKPNSVGLEALKRAAANNLAGAAVLLDWVREDEHLAGGDDPLTGAIFPRFWTKGKPASADQMKLAAAAMLVESKPTAAQGIVVFEAAKDSAKSDNEKTNFALALLTGYMTLEKYEKAAVIADDLAKQFPESTSLFLTQQKALASLGRFKEADQLSQVRLKRLPDDLDATRSLVLSAVQQGNFALAHDLEKKIVSSGKAEAVDLNSVAWQSLFLNNVTADDLDAAVRAVRANPNDMSAMHTLGCVYAEVGKTKEARDVLVQAMTKLNLSEPSSIFWYAFGRIAEQDGEREAAIAAYSKVTKPKAAIEIAGSSYQLAQMRLKVMDAEKR
jgi:predicted Zn-dependent protease